MDVGMALPTMVRRYDRATTLDWCRGIDDGPFSSASCGERVTFHNQDMLVTSAAAAALTERVRVFVNLVVTPMHPVAVLAKELATLDVLSAGRLSVAVGVGGRNADYRAAGADPKRRHARLDADVAELRRLWAGAPPWVGSDPVGPPPVQPGGPPLLAGAMGPRSMARAAGWADGVSSFSLSGDGAEVAAAARLAEQAWTDAGREQPPRRVTGCFFVLGGSEPAATLSRFVADYLAIFGSSLATAVAAGMTTSSPGEVRRVLEDARAAGVDEFILVPGSADPACLDAAAEVVGAG